MLQKELARRVGLSDRELRRIERGHVRPNSECLEAIADVLSVEIGELYARKPRARR
jgi:DNA-binding XRE family transcriptional regulator